MINLSYLVRRILDTALHTHGNIESLQAFKDSYEHQPDGTDILVVEGISNLELAEEYIIEHGKEAFVDLFERSGDLSMAIYSAADTVVSEKGVSASFEILDQIIEQASSVKAPAGFKLKCVYIISGSSALDHFPPKSVIGNCEKYRDLEGSGNCDVYRNVATAAGAQFDYSIEAWIEKESE